MYLQKKTKGYSKHCEFFLIGIGANKTATITMIDDAYKELTKQGTK